MPAVHITANKETETFKIYFQCQIHASEYKTCVIISKLIVHAHPLSSGFKHCSKVFEFSHIFWSTL